MTASWISPVILNGKYVRLEPMTEDHIPGRNCKLQKPGSSDADPEKQIRGQL